MASLNLAGKTSGYVKVTAPDDSSTNPTVVLPKESGELALKSDITGGGGDSIWTESGDIAVYDGDIKVNDVTVGSKGNANSTAVGRNAMGALTTGTHNTSLGYSSLRELTDGTHNTALGVQTLLNNVSGKNNIAIGHNALQETLSDNNTAIGYVAGRDITTGKNNTCIGHSAQPSAPDVSNEITLGNSSVTKVRMGNGDVLYPNSGAMVGAVVMWANNKVPTGWLECDGSDIPSQYTKLISLVGSTVPDLRGDFVRGWDHGKGTDSGRALLSHQSEMVNPQSLRVKGGGNESGSTSSFRWTSNLGSVSDRSAVGGSGTETRPRNKALMFIINADGAGETNTMVTELEERMAQLEKKAS